MVNGYCPASLKDALKIRAQEKVTPYSGGTDLMIDADKHTVYLFLNKVRELKNITVDETSIRIGAACTYTELLESPFIPPILKGAVRQIAAPAIRNTGTAGGNICNASPKADSAHIFFVTNAKLRLASVRGERIVPIRRFCLGRNKTVLAADELLVEILMPKTGHDNYYYQKVGARNALAITRVSFAGLLDMENRRIKNCSTAFGAISDIILCREDIDAMLTGKTAAEASAAKNEYLAAYDRAIIPIRGRVSAEYRKQVCMNLLRNFLASNGI